MSTPNTASNTNRHGSRNWGLRPLKLGYLNLAFLTQNLLDKVSSLRLQSAAVYPGRKIISKLRSAMAFVLTLWCAGAGCMIVSYARADAITSQQNPGDAPSMGSHACCKVRHSSSRRNAGSATSRNGSLPVFQQVAIPREPASSGAASCCPLTSGSFVVQSRSQSDDDRVLALNHNDSLSFMLTNSQTPIRAIPLRLLSQEQAYLTCCAFLI